ncbi:MAG: sulfite reductase subunit beta (hemoprotein), partial [Deltaproteobacteria bacterium]|nr:sulfite reductase subunit beta (hemoprotein) [Deltaproteobacteria bacterium]
MKGYYQIPSEYGKELEQFIEGHRAFSEGRLDKGRWKALRVGFGVYEQRRENTYMVRIRCAAGAVTPAQFRAVAELSRRYAAGHIHITTRFELQLHDVSFEDLPALLRA